MAHAKKGQLHQIVFPMVDSTDFASVESGITESDFNSGATRRFYGWNTGASTATTSGAISKTGSLVRSGVFRLTLKTTENNYDEMMVRINKTGCAEQIITWSNVDNDDSDLMSQILLATSAASDAASAAVQANSRVLLNQSRISDIQSFLSDFQSDLVSHIDTTGVLLNASVMSDLRSAIAGGPAATVTASDISDIASAVRAALVSDLSDILSAAVQTNSRVLLNQSRISDIASVLSDFQSDFQSRVPKAVATNSQLSDLHSDLRSYLVGISGAVSDVYSMATAIFVEEANLSELISHVPSAVKVALGSDMSDILSAAVQANSRVLLCQSRISDVQSFLSDFQSDLISHLDTTGVQLNASVMSDLRSAVAAVTVNLTASDISDIASAVAAAVTTITASDISDIASAVKATLASDLSDILSAAVQTNSRVLLNKSAISDIYSMLSDVQSDFQSRVPKAVATNSQLSDLHSDLRSFLVVISGVQSDLYSAVSDMQSDFQSRVPKRVATDSQLSDLASDVKSAVVVVLSLVSDVQSQIAAGVELGASSLSDLRSAITAGPTSVELGASSLSDLRSAILIGPTDVQLNASSLSDLRSAIAAVTLTASDVSDIASAVRAVVASDLSDILSAVLAVPTANQNADALLDRANGIETSLSPRGAFRLIVAASAGKLSGAATTTVAIRNVGDSKDRITATVDSSGNRTAVTTDAT